MSEPTVVAIVILVGVFLVMGVTIAKEGTDKAIKLWGVMGALTGVAFGAITSYYFTDQTYRSRVARLQAKVKTSEVALDQAARKAETLQASMREYAQVFSGGNTAWTGDPYVLNLANSLNPSQRDLLAERFQSFSSELLTIEDLNKNREKQEHD